MRPLAMFLRRPPSPIAISLTLPFPVAARSDEPPKPMVIIRRMPKDSLFARTNQVMEASGYRVTYESFGDGEMMAKRFGEGGKEEWRIPPRGPSLRGITRVKGTTFPLMVPHIGVDVASNRMSGASARSGERWYTDTIDSLRGIRARKASR